MLAGYNHCLEIQPNTPLVFLDIFPPQRSCNVIISHESLQETCACLHHHSYFFPAYKEPEASVYIPSRWMATCMVTRLHSPDAGLPWDAANRFS